jgi:hypothetical protein
MKETFNRLSAILLVVLLVLLVLLIHRPAADEEASSPTDVIVATQPPVTETVEPTVTLPPETVEATLPAVDNPVNDVNNSVETTGSAYVEQELEILAIIIYQEAGADYCSDDTRRKVGSVFLNRVNSPFFPDTFEEVATQTNQYGTLCQTGLKWPDRASYPEEAHAVERAYDIAEELLIGGSILPDNVIWQAGFKQGDGVYCYQDNTYFCYSEVNK